MEHGCSKTARLALGVLPVLFLFGQAAHGQTTTPAPPFDNSFNVPDVTGVLPTATDAQGVTQTLRIFVLMTVLTLVPSILIMTTAFPRIIIVLALLRQAIGTPQLPPGQVLLGLSLFITMLVMAPTWHLIQNEVVGPYFDGEMAQAEALDLTTGHLKDFMYRQIAQAGNDEDVFLFLEYAEQREIPTGTKIEVGTVPMTVMVPAFILSELKTAFIMGFRIYLPFLVIDMVIATVLISMGMMMLPPVLISLPFKLLLFVLADGWHLVVGTLLNSFA